MARTGVKPTINALSTLMFASVLLLLFIINIRTDRGEKKKKTLKIDGSEV
jgi:ABC-type spermidine/putrescine transport system, permease component II